MPKDEAVDKPTIWVWPGSTIPLPESYRGGDTLPGKDDGELRACEVPEEFYLREVMDLDLSSAEAIVEFCRLWGDLGLLCHEHEVYRGFIAAYEAEYSYPVDVDAEPVAPTDPIVRFRAVAKVVRDMTRIWPANQGALSFAELATSWESPGTPPASPADALDRLSIGLNLALQPFQVHAVVEPGGQESGTLEPTLLSVVCLQLANDINDKPGYSRCRNENCGRLFARQRGRAQAGQYRTVGVEYCSRSCALAQSQRNWRRRRREAKKAGEETA